MDRLFLIIVGVLFLGSMGLAQHSSFSMPMAVDFDLWTEETFPPVPNNLGQANWVVQPDDTMILQTDNGQPTFYYSDFTSSFNKEITISMTVNTPVGFIDDDFIGFAIGFTPGDATLPADPGADYLILDWKKATQGPVDFGPDGNGGTGLIGMALSRVSGFPSANELYQHTDYPDIAPFVGSVTEIARATNLGSTAWAFDTTYDFEITYTPDRIQVRVNGVLEFDEMGSFPDGRATLYNFSQDNVLYEADSVLIIPQALPDSDTVAENSVDNVLNFPDGLTGSDDDGSPLTDFTITTAPTDGVLDISSASISCDNPAIPVTCTFGPVTYTPAPDFFGSDSFEFTVTDGIDTSLPAVFDIEVTEDTTPPETITIIKNTVPDDPQDFAFTDDIAAPNAFSLDDDVDGTLSNTETFLSVTPGTYTVTETPIAGYTTTVDCNDPDNGSTISTVTNVASIDLDAGESITCTFTNTKLGTIIIEKNTSPEDDADFTFSGDLGAFTLDDDGAETDNPPTQYPSTITFANLAIDTAYDVTEDVLGTHTLTGLVCDDDASSVPSTEDIPGRTATINLEAGETVTCTFTNILTPTMGTIIIEKNTSPDDAVDFTFSGDLGAFTLDDDGEETDNPPTQYLSTIMFADIAIGPYDVTEDVSGTHTLTGLVCDDDASSVPSTEDIPGRTATINLEDGETVTCTFTNTPTPTANLRFEKVMNPEADIDVEFSTDFGTIFLCDNGASACTSTNPDFSDHAGIAIGSYSITEENLAGYGLSSIVCTDNNLGGAFSGVTNTIIPGGNFEGAVDLDLADGDDVTCVFTNDEDPEEFGTITINKVYKQSEGEEFGFSSLGLAPTSFDLSDGESRTFDNVPIGAYDVTEDDPSPLGLIDIDCITTGDATAGEDEQGRTANIILNSHGDTVECTFFNVDPCDEPQPPMMYPNFILGLLVPEEFRAYGGSSSIIDLPCADLSLSKEVGDSTPIAGGLVTYTFLVSNDGPDTATGVEVLDFYDSNELSFFGIDVVQGSINGPLCCSINPVRVSIDSIASGELAIFTLTFIVEEIGELVNFAEISASDQTDPDSIPNNGNGLIAQEDDEAAVKITPCNDEEPEPFEIPNMLLSLLVPEMYQAYGGSTVIPIIPCSESNNDSLPYPDPNLGDPKHGQGHSDGFCMNQNCMDVTGLFNHFPEAVVPQGSTQSFSLLISCPRGAHTCDHISLAGALPDADFYTDRWTVTVDKQPMSDEWDLTVMNDYGEINAGGVTVTVQPISQTFVTATINVPFVIPGSIGSEDGVDATHANNRHLHVVVHDSHGGASNYIFNEGMYVQDIYAYPQLEMAFDPALEYEPLCLNEDSKKRHNCAFDKVKDWTIKNAEEKLKEMNVKID